MRALVIAAFAAAIAALSGPAEAQRIAPPPAPQQGGWTGGPPPGGQWHGGDWNGGARPAQYPNGQRSRWGHRVNGYWYAGVQAPGGWQAYRRMKRGRTLPGYWLSPSFYINDWSSFGLASPPAGYSWSRYYNDAVLIDRSGRVYDSVSSINWDIAGAYDDGYGYGYGYDPAPQPYGVPYPAPGYPGPAYPAPYVTSSADGRVTTYTTTTVSGAPYVQPAPLVIPAGSYATVTMPGAVTTTTTTEYIEESYAAPVVVKKKVYRAPVKRKWRPRPKPRCCVCACR